ncbi:MAG: SMI1/KNR4 family protein [Acidobacteria bacterium]|nr:SMI1/KNR4 family protein [Acidobacteriota bacterium]
MEHQWERLKAWLRAHAPHLLPCLQEGVTDQELDDFEWDIGVTLPRDFRAFYKVHNGEPELCGGGLIFGLQLLPLAEIREQQAAWADLVDMNEEMADSMESEPEGAIQLLYANPLWLPFTHDQGGNHLGLDFDPGPKGTPGQVIVFGRDEDRKKLVAPSFAAFLDGVIRELEGGNYVLRDGRLRFAHYPGDPNRDASEVHANYVFGAAI